MDRPSFVRARLGTAVWLGLSLLGYVVIGFFTYGVWIAAAHYYFGDDFCHPLGFLPEGGQLSNLWIGFGITMIASHQLGELAVAAWLARYLGPSRLGPYLLLLIMLVCSFLLLGAFIAFNFLYRDPGCD